MLVLEAPEILVAAKCCVLQHVRAKQELQSSPTHVQPFNIAIDIVIYQGHI